mmetsp:Transcript_37820/g.100000  ORF Transcript_37820/g.100000 Transcript_37820/m.100000 type:complete len:221 (-) Transcript_37820:1927-2589(-)
MMSSACWRICSAAAADGPCSTIRSLGAWALVPAAGFNAGICSKMLDATFAASPVKITPLACGASTADRWSSVVKSSSSASDTFIPRKATIIRDSRAARLALWIMPAPPFANLSLKLANNSMDIDLRLFPVLLLPRAVFRRFINGLSAAESSILAGKPKSTRNAFRISSDMLVVRSRSMSSASSSSSLSTPSNAGGRQRPEGALRVACSSCDCGRSSPTRA